MGVDGGALLAVDVVLLFPGQGSQKAGMGRDLADEFPGAKRVFEAADDALGTSLSKLCFDGPEADLTSTENAQPALLAHSAAVWSIVRERLAQYVRAAAGHSLGEFTAHHAAGTFALADSLRLVRRRGELMRDSGIRRPGTMAAIMGLAEQRVEAACERATEEAGVVVPANYNTPEQLVISGEVSGVERAMTLAKKAGAKHAIRLNVSGAFHSPLMEDAAEGLEKALNATPSSTQSFPVYSNVTAASVDGAPRVRELLLKQLTSPVRWAEQVRNLATAFPEALFVELAFRSVLSNLVKRIVPKARTVKCGTTSEVEALMRLIA